MFEKYNLVHFEVTSPLVQGGTQFERNVKVSAEELDQTFPTTADLGRSMSGASYRITGSFDYLLPSIRKNAPDEFAGSQLVLQSFCVMSSAPDYYTRRENYESILFSYTYAGEGLLRYGGKTYVVTPGTGFVIDCRLPHEYRSNGEHWQHADIHLWGAQAELLYKCFERTRTVAFTYAPAAVDRQIEKVLDSYTNPSELRNLFVGNALSDLLCAVLRNSEKDSSATIPQAYRRLVRYMEGHYMQALHLDELAERFHISKYHMSREFKRYTGYSPGEYLIMLRVQHATILLAQSDLSIEGIAAQAGFSNMSNFIGQIRKRTGMTPSEFRRMSKARV